MWMIWTKINLVKQEFALSSQGEWRTNEMQLSREQFSITLMAKSLMMLCVDEFDLEISSMLSCRNPSL